MTAPDAARLADWRALAEAATPGPWYRGDCCATDENFALTTYTVDHFAALCDAVERLRADVDVAERQANNHAEDAIVAERERDALRAELSAIHATTDWQRWAWAVAERDAARAENARLRECIDDASLCIAAGHRAEQAEAAVRRVKALCDGSNWWPSGAHAVSVAAVRAALAGPGATT